MALQVPLTNELSVFEISNTTVIPVNKLCIVTTSFVQRYVNEPPTFGQVLVTRCVGVSSRYFRHTFCSRVDVKLIEHFTLRSKLAA